MKRNRIVSLLALASMMISSAVFPVQADTLQGYENITLPEETIQEDPNLLMYFDISLSRV